MPAVLLSPYLFVNTLHDAMRRVSPILFGLLPALTLASCTFETNTAQGTRRGILQGIVRDGTLGVIEEVQPAQEEPQATGETQPSESQPTGEQTATGGEGTETSPPPEGAAGRSTTPFFVTVKPPVDALFGIAGQPNLILLKAGEFTTVAGNPVLPTGALYEYDFQVSPPGTYTFAIVPAKDPPFVPTEGETLSAMGIDPSTATEEQRKTATLTLRVPDDGFNGIRLQHAEGAYVEGVVRFELASGPMAVASRRTRAP